MKKYLSILTFSLIGFLFVTFAYAQVNTESPTAEEIKAFLDSLNAVGGLKGSALIMAVVQGLMLMARSSIGNLAGKYKLLILTGLTLAASILAGLSQGQSFIAALLSGGALATLQVFIHQIMVQMGKAE